VDSIDGTPGAGEVVQVLTANHQIVGWGAFSPVSQIKVRMWSFEEDEFPNKELISSRILSAVEMRKSLPDTKQTNALRLVHSESDYLPGTIVDQFGDMVILQLHTTGAYHFRETIHHSIMEITGCKTLIENSSDDILKLEGLLPFHKIIGETVRVPFIIEEHGIRYFIDTTEGQKTGFYLDQRQNRLAIRKYANGKRVLDAFSYSGGFSMNAFTGSAYSVTSVDSSASALDLLQKNIEENQYSNHNHSRVQANVFDYLRKMRDRNEQYDLIVLDPPKLAPTRAQAEKAARAYKDLQLMALKSLLPEGILMTFSCSGGVTMDLFKKILMDAALDAKREVQIVEQLHQSADHPINPNFPEGEYLKGLVCVVK
jgi:23S rRNA (cytosine1962-C5)-methyltransferase